MTRQRKGIRLLALLLGCLLLTMTAVSPGVHAATSLEQLEERQARLKRESAERQARLNKLFGLTPQTPQTSHS